MKMSIIIW